jgi:hypothetical protein
VGSSRAIACLAVAACNARLGGAGPTETVDASTAAVDATRSSDAAIEIEIDAPALKSWSKPDAIPGVNSGSSEDDPSVTADRFTIVFTSNRGGNYDLYIGRRAALTDAFTVDPLTSLNSMSAETSPEISSDGKALYFISKRTGTNLVYRSTYDGATWADPKPASDLAACTGADVAISPDGLQLLCTIATTSGNQVLHSTRASTTATWPTPTREAALEVTTDIAAPTLTNEGATIYLHAGNPRDLYVSIDFATPTRIEELASAGRDAAPFADATATHLAFNRDGDLYETSR